MLLALILASWGALPSSSPDSTPDPQKETQPSQRHASPDPLVKEQQKKPGDGANKEKNQSDLLQWVEENSNLINAASTAIMAIFTVALFFSTHLLWKSGERHSARELRAYVFIDKILREMHHDSPFRVTVFVRNFGQTPAYGLTIESEMDFHAEERKEFVLPPQTNPDPSVTTIPPGGTGEHVLTHQWTEKEFEFLKDGKSRFYFFGIIRYRDAFGKDRWTRFRYKSTPLFKVGEEWRVDFAATHKGNECDEGKKKGVWFLRWLPS